MSTHGYGAYTRGCRCDVCRDAKADYMRERRAGARRAAHDHGPFHTATGITHGTRHGYEEHGCRCLPCTDARVESDRFYRKSKRNTA